jgi:hypothetical protein
MSPPRRPSNHCCVMEPDHPQDVPLLMHWWSPGDPPFILRKSPSPSSTNPPDDPISPGKSGRSEQRALRLNTGGFGGCPATLAAASRVSHTRWCPGFEPGGRGFDPLRAYCRIEALRIRVRPFFVPAAGRPTSPIIPNSGSLLPLVPTSHHAAFKVV